MEYLHNNLTKSMVNENTNNYILKVNSRDRNIIQEPNPFDFKIKFNKTPEKFTTYYEKGYFGSGNKWKNNDSAPQNTWNDTSYYYNKTFKVSNGAVIEDPIEEIKDINITEIVAPRYIPDDKIGYQINSVEVMSNPIDISGIYLRGIDNTKIKYIIDEYTYNGALREYRFFEIQDIYSKRFFLFSQDDMLNLAGDLKKNYYLFNDYYTDTLCLNNQIYKIYDISNGYIRLTKGVSETVKLDFLKSDLRLAKYYQDSIWYQKNAVTSNLNFGNEYIKIDESGESLITSELVKDSVIEVIAEDATSLKKKYHYFKISSVNHCINLQNELSFTNVKFNNSNKTITLDKLKSSEMSILMNLQNIKHIDVTSVANGGCKDVINIEAIGDCKIIITVSNTLTTITEDATMIFKKELFKTFPYVNLTDSEYKELQTFLTDPINTEIKNTVVIQGNWIYNNKAVPSGTNNYYLAHIKQGVKDLLNEKLFYLSLEPIVPSKNLITNGELNNVIGTFYPSTQSKNYIFLNGQNRQRFTHRNLQNLRDLKFKLYYMNGTLVGETLKNYSLDFLERDCKQTNITFLIDQVDRHLS